jgi:uncharacterized protein
MADTAAPAPVAPRERILALDVLRGFAMFGVLVAYCMWSLGTAPEDRWSALDRAIAEATAFAVDGKFYTILAFLFGVGFSIQLQRAADSSDAVRLFARRLTVHAAIGLVHALLLRNGDILLPYAVTGFLLIPFRRSSGPVLLAAAIIALFIPDVARALWEASGAPIPERPALENQPYLVENLAWVRYWYQTAIFTWPANLTLFLLGYYAGSRAILAKLGAEPRKLAAILICGVAAGAALYFLRLALIETGRSSPVEKAALGLMFDLHCWSIGSAYVAALLLALKSRRGEALLSPLAAIGRLALTNYVMQAGLIVPLCLLLGWFDNFTPSTSLALALAVFVLVQLPFSLWWLRRYQFGPAEWIWRRFTYSRVPPLKLADRGSAGI